MSSLSASRLNVNPTTATEQRLYRLALAERIASYSRRPRTIDLGDYKCSRCLTAQPLGKIHSPCIAS